VITTTGLVVKWKISATGEYSTRRVAPYRIPIFCPQIDSHQNLVCKHLVLYCLGYVYRPGWHDGRNGMFLQYLCIALLLSAGTDVRLAIT
jgi:hypothetical protein